MSSGRGGSVVGAVISVVAILAVVILVVTLFTVTRFSTQPNEAGLHYSAGPLSPTKYENCIPPSSRVWDGPADDHYAYPSDERYYAFGQTSDNSAATEAAPITILTANGTELTIRGLVTFDLVTDDCDTLRAFHEEYGLGRDAYIINGTHSPGWNSMLDVFFGNALQRAINEATQTLSWEDIYNNLEVKAQWERDVATNLPKYLKQSMDGKDYFRVKSITIQKPDVPDSLKESILSRQVAIQDNLAQQERNTAVLTKIESIRALVEILGPEGYNVYNAVTEGQVDVMPVPTGSSVIVQPKATE